MKKPIEINTHDHDVYDKDEFIFCKNPNGEITSCGFSVKSALLREGKSPMMGLKSFLRGSAQNSDDDDDDLNGYGEENVTMTPGNNVHHVSDMFKNMSIPAGIFYMQQQKTHPCKQENMYEEEEVTDTLIDKLLALASAESEKRKRKNGTGTRKVGIVLVAGAKKQTKTRKIQKDKHTKG